VTFAAAASSPVTFPVPVPSLPLTVRKSPAFAYLGLTVFTSYFLNYAATELDIPAGG
jgi:hypothetical protein